MTRPCILLLLFALLAWVRISAPTDLLEGDQEKQVEYVMDILHHQDWLVQYEINGQVANKPPLYNWLAVAVCKLFHTQAEWAIKLPSLFAAMGLLICVYLLARKLFDEQTAFYACVACLTSHHFAKLMWFARTDMLLACLLHLAITLLVCLRSSWWKSLLIGFVVALAGLTKGPIGPVLFGLFLALWTWREERMAGPRPWRRLLPGLAVFVVLCGGWTAAVWNMPRFHDYAIKYHLVDHMFDPAKSRPIYYYVGHLLTRIAPWPLVAAVGLAFARRRDEWKTARFILIWGAVFFAMFSLLPVKRHDQLFPVYPAVFLLAGLGLRFLLEPVVRPEARWLMYPLGGFLAAAPILEPWVDSTPASWIIVAATICGTATLVAVWLGRRVSLAVAAAGLVLAQGVYHHWGHQLGRADYADLSGFTRHVADVSGKPEQVLVFYAHPLIAYELGQHRKFENPEDLTVREGDWLVAPYYLQDLIQQKTGWKLTEESRMSIRPRREEASLFKIDRTQQFAARDEGGRKTQ